MLGVVGRVVSDGHPYPIIRLTTLRFGVARKEHPPARRRPPILLDFAPLTGGKWVVFLEIRAHEFEVYDAVTT